MVSHEFSIYAFGTDLTRSNFGKLGQLNKSSVCVCVCVRACVCVCDASMPASYEKNLDFVTF